MDRHVYTIEDGRVGGRPGPMKVPWDLEALKSDGWTVIVSFECHGIDEEEIRAAGIEHVRMCIEDFTAPTMDQIAEFNTLVDAKLREGKKVLSHCYAGRGRTGTMLASRLVLHGAHVQDAVETVRRKVLDSQGTLAGAIEPVQVEALYRLARLPGAAEPTGVSGR